MYRAYINACRQFGCVPVSIFQRHIGDTTMDLSEHSLGAKGAKAIAKALENNATVESLVRLHVQSPTCVHLCPMPLSCVCHMFAPPFAPLLEQYQCQSLANCDIREEGTTAVAAMLQENSYIRSVDLSSNAMGSRGLVAVAGMLAASVGVTALELRANGLLDVDMVPLGPALQSNATLRTLGLSANRLGDVAAIRLASAVANNCGS
jgi:hypothetical protein